VELKELLFEFGLLVTEFFKCSWAAKTMRQARMMRDSSVIDGGVRIR